MDKIQTSNMDQIWKKNISGVTLSTLIILVIATVLFIYICMFEQLEENDMSCIRQWEVDRGTWN